MVVGDVLSGVLSEFARTLVTDFPIQGILDHLVQRIVEVLPVTGAGVTLISPGMAPQYVAASDELALALERLQTELGQGPCLAAYETGATIVVADLAVDVRFPAFGLAAVEAGMAAVFTFPLRHGGGCLGALGLYRVTSGPLSPADLAAAQTLADVTSAYLLNAQARDQALEISDRFRDSALHDALTGLPNRVLLQQRLTHAAERSQRSHATVAVLFADLDRFKHVNDSYGHAVGDELLVAVAQRLAGVLRPGDTLARVSGDEFVVLCEDLADAGDAELLAARIAEAFSTPFGLGGLELFVTASVGIAYAGAGEAVTNQLVIDADIAMYQAKRRGGAAHQVIDLRDAQIGHARNHLDQDLYAALTRAQLDLAYQPIVRTADRCVSSVEALLRWAHPDHGPIPALAAVSVAEQNGLITQIGAWVLERSCRDRMSWLAAHPTRALGLSVNVSARQLLGAGYAAAVAAALDTTGMDPAALTLELTEGIFIDNADRGLNVLTDLKTLGVALALDDFGTGYSSLGYLRQFPVDIVKIDRGFIADIGRNPAGVAIITAVTTLAHTLGLTVTAEGVETQRQHDTVTRIGCDHAQGFLYAQPMPRDDITRLLTSPARPLRRHAAPNLTLLLDR